MGRHRDTVQRRRAVKDAAAAVGTAAMAVAGAVTIGVAPGMTAAPALTASLHYLRGTNIGYRPSEQEFHRFIDAVVDGTGVEPPDAPYEQVGYNAGFWPVSRGGFKDLTFDNSVRQGMQSLQAEQPAGSDLIFGYSQGAVAASLYKADHTGNTYLLVANPNRANGGIMQRFNGIKIPILDFTFNGATPNNGDPTYDIVRQYDGWSDFPTYLWNPIAVANAFMGILLVHGNTQLELTAADLDAAKNSGDPDYYQFDAGSKTHYYVIKTYPVPLLMPLDALLPDAIIAALDAPLRRFIELAYDRSDYSVPTRAKFFGPLTPREPSTMAELAPVRPSSLPTRRTPITSPRTPGAGPTTTAAQARRPPWMRSRAPRSPTTISTPVLRSAANSSRTRANRWRKPSRKLPRKPPRQRQRQPPPATMTAVRPGTPPETPRATPPGRPTAPPRNPRRAGAPPLPRPDGQDDREGVPDAAVLIHGGRRS